MVASTAVLALVVVGCGSQAATDTQAGAGPPEGCANWPECDGLPADEPPTTPEDEPSSACAVPDGHEVPADCAPHDIAASMAANDAYRQRSELTGENRQLAEADMGRIGDGLEHAAAAGPLTRDDVFRVLTGMGYEDNQVYEVGDSGVLTVGVATVGGCVHGAIRGSEVTLETGSIIADGGCLTAPGH